jgi:hypothetical protein
LASDHSDWISFDRYLAIYDTTLREFDHLVEQDTTAFEFPSSSVAVLRGRLHCVSGMYLQIHVVFNRRPANLVCVRRYTFHAGMVRQVDRPIFRYDNAHTYVREGQMDQHHKHRFDVITGKEIVPPVWIGAANQPTLHSVLAELQQWWFDVGQALPPVDASSRS